MRLSHSLAAVVAFAGVLATGSSIHAAHVPAPGITFLMIVRTRTPQMGANIANRLAALMQGGGGGRAARGQRGAAGAGGAAGAAGGRGGRRGRGQATDSMMASDSTMADSMAATRAAVDSTPAADTSSVQETMIMASGKATAAGTRLDVSGIAALAPDDYVLVMDSARVLVVHPSTKTYGPAGSDLLAATAFAGAGMGGRGGAGNPGAFGGRGGGAGGRGGPPGGGNAGAGGRRGRGGAAAGTDSGTTTASAAAMANGANAGGGLQPQVDVAVESLGPGDPVDGQPTKHYRVTTHVAINVAGVEDTIALVTEAWTEKLEVPIENPFGLLSRASLAANAALSALRNGGGMPGGMGGGAGLGGGAYAEKMGAAMKQMDGTPVRTVTTLGLPRAIAALAAQFGAAGMLGGPDTLQTTIISSVHHADVDAASVSIPAGYTLETGRGRGGRGGGGK